MARKQRTLEEGRKLVEQIESIGGNIKKACESIGVYPSAYYKWKQKVKSVSRKTATTNLVTKRSYRKRVTNDLTTATTAASSESSIPVILTRLTPTQLAAFMRA
jgi:transposase-like protein